MICQNGRSKESSDTRGLFVLGIYINLFFVFSVLMYERMSLACFTIRDYLYSK